MMSDRTWTRDGQAQWWVEGAKVSVLAYHYRTELSLEDLKDMALALTREDELPHGVTTQKDQDVW